MALLSNVSNEKFRTQNAVKNACIQPETGIYGAFFVLIKNKTGGITSFREPTARGFGDRCPYVVCHNWYSADQHTLIYLHLGQPCVVVRFCLST